MSMLLDQPSIPFNGSRRRGANSTRAASRSGPTLIIFLILASLFAAAYFSWRLLQAESLRRYRDQVNYLTNTGDEWITRPPVALVRYKQALMIAETHHFDASVVRRRIESLPRATSLPESAVAEVIRARVSPPVVEFEIAITNETQVLEGLSSADFQVIANGKALRHFAVRETTAPLKAQQHVAILVDRSSSVAGERLAAIKTSINRFVESAGTDARIMVLSFANSVSADTPWTNDRLLLNHAVDRLSASGGTALCNAVHVAASELSRREGARNLIVFSDGKNTEAGLSLPELVAFCHAHEVTVDCVGFDSGDIDRSFVETLSSKTGGTFSLATEPRELVTRVAAISERLAGKVYRLAILDFDESLTDLTIQIGAERALEVPVTVRPSLAVAAADATRVSQMTK